MATANDSLKAKEELDNNQLLLERSMGPGYYPFYLERQVKNYLRRFPGDDKSLPLDDLYAASYYLNLLLDYTARKGVTRKGVKSFHE